MLSWISIFVQLRKKKKNSVKVEFLFRDQVGTAYFFIHSASSCVSLACFVAGALLVVQSMNQVISNSWMKQNQEKKPKNFTSWFVSNELFALENDLHRVKQPVCVRLPGAEDQHNHSF